MATSTVLLPEPIDPPFEVYVNGVLQREGVDYTATASALTFTRVLANEGELSFRHWLLGAWGIGSYRANDAVDVRYRADGRPRVLEGLLAEPSGGSQTPQEPRRR